MADPQPKPSDVRAAVHDELCGWPDENDVDRVLDTYADHLSAAGFRLVPPGWRIVKVEHPDRPDMSAPKRIRRSRAKGWRMPVGAIYVGRPTVWGNPITLANLTIIGFDSRGGLVSPRRPTMADVVAEYRTYLTEEQPELLAKARTELPGHDLACWCPLDRPCHADVLLELANAR